MQILPVYLICVFNVDGIENEQSDPLGKISNVLQGSILGPSLFVLYFNDLTTYVYEKMFPPQAHDTLGLVSEILFRKQSFRNFFASVSRKGSEGLFQKHVSFNRTGSIFRKKFLKPSCYQVINKHSPIT